MKKILPLLLGISFFCSSVFAAPFSQIVFFGDSLTDNGNLYRAAKIIPESPPYYDGRFSNGFTWAEDLYKYYYDKYYIAVLNEGYGGTTVLPPSRSSNSQMTLRNRIHTYLSDPSVPDDKSSVLYVIWIGANDYLWDTTSDLDTLTRSVVRELQADMEILMNEGARHFLVLNLPDLGKTPYARESGIIDRMHDASEKHNTVLRSTITALQNQYPADRFMMIDVESTFNDLIANPQKYDKNITNVTDPCLDSMLALKHSDSDKINLSNQLKKAFAADKKIQPDVDPQAMSDYVLNSPMLAQTYRLGQLHASGTASICSDADAHVFWDVIHPTEAAHRVLSSVIVKQLMSAGEG